MLSKSKGSYVHFHSLYGSLGTIITIICLIMRVGINVLWHTGSSLLVCYISHLSWLFTIIKSFEHSSIRASFRKYEVVLENAILSLTNLGTIDWTNDLWSIILKVLHETSLSIVHDILRRILLFIWVVESWCSSVWSGAKVWLVHLILFVHQNYAVILLVTWIATFETTINCSSNWATTIWELASSLLIRLVEGVSGTVSCWFPSSTYSSMIATGSVAVSSVGMSSLSESSDIHSSVHGIGVLEITRTSLDWSFPIMVDIDSGVHVVVVLVTIYRHAVLMLLVVWVTSSSVCSLLSQFCLSNCFRDLLVVVTTTLIRSRRVHAVEHVLIVLSRIEKLLSSHHHLLLLILASIWCFPLVY